MKQSLNFLSFFSRIRLLLLTVLLRLVVNLSLPPSRHQQQRGASALEYALILAVIVVLIAVAVSTTGLGQKAADAFTNLSANFN